MVGVVVLAFISGAVWAVWLGVRGVAGGSEAGPSEDVVATTVVARRTLEERVVTRGVTGFVPAGELRIAASGRVTKVLLGQGGLVEEGDAVVVVDGRAVVVVSGVDPLWRDLARNSRGADVASLQGLLVAMGLLEMEPDGRFGASTEAAVRRWQERFGFVVVDGVFRMGDIVVGDWPLRVSQVRVDVGDFVQAGASLAGLTSLEPGVTIELLPSARLLVAEGAVVRVEVSATGIVATGVLGSVDEDPWERPEGGFVFMGQVILDEELDVPEGTQTRVLIITARAEDVVVVPLASLISDGAGRPLVRVVGEGSEIRSVPLVLGMSDGAWVEVVSGIEEGQTVLVAAVFREE